MTQPVVLITGAAKRVGRVIAQRFARAGYAVVVHYGNSQSEALETVALIEATGNRAIACRADLANPTELGVMMATTYATFERLDVLVNCAAIFFPDTLADFALNDLERSWQINCRAPLLLTQSFYQQAKIRGQQGVVVNVVDQKVRENFHPDDFSYTVAKAALGNMTAMLAVSGGDVLRVNALYPGLMTPSGDQTQADFEFSSARSTPLGYVAPLGDIADAILLLTRPSFNGAEFVVDAGQNLVRVERDVVNLYRAP
ncbi:SDR family oxidoreductase [Glaciimonas immobilis]|uniref:NAD(P)-dependent dehydrogenase (Short-subunit alcohol dehydrogenase family) n=1 Tax=Glaciimonas immobilis TaxID=728004 RepID=A0A840RXW3_9BURK|nr:SDR family oxidoreductase [Glaciimonas immobilis]KAF3996777.1 SDR family oxidoreductase [Glaciimonas immobilis]MBB5201290.1 NAD(P)-dependent dehydrogenase (short-subunit alcohol dehydrogenase family) [Glaciimonas immobilis]